MSIKHGAIVTGQINTLYISFVGGNFMISSTGGKLRAIKKMKKMNKSLFKLTQMGFARWLKAKS